MKISQVTPFLTSFSLLTTDYSIPPNQIIKSSNKNFKTPLEKMISRNASKYLFSNTNLEKCGYEGLWQYKIGNKF